MITFCFHNEADRLSYSVVANYRHAWEAICGAWGLNDPLMIDLTGEYFNNNVNCFRSLAEVVRAFKNYQFLYLCTEMDTIPNKKEFLLHEFAHPTENAIYVFGPNYGDTAIESFPDEVSLIHVEGATPAGIGHTLWALDCANVVAYDRHIKNKLGI